MHLDVHLEGGQRIYFNTDNIGERLENPRQTTLLAFFRLCETDNFAKTLLYEEVPAYYTYDKQRGVFNSRRRGATVEGVPGIFKEHTLGRVYTVHVNNTELFYLRLLLHTVRGPTSFGALRSVNDVEQPNFLAACRVRHLLDDDQHWDHTLAEACVSDSPRRLRNLFCIMLVFCGLSDAAQLWTKYKQAFAEDFLRDDRCLEVSLNICLRAIQDTVLTMGGNSLVSYGLPESPSNSDSEQRGSREYTAETSYNSRDLTKILRECLPKLTEEQQSVFHRVCDSTTNNLGEMFFLDAPGGTGKTFLTKVILAKIRNQGKIALAVASSGIAATLLPGGKTAHAMFKIPIQLDTTETPVCDISRNSDKARILRDCCLIVWDECTMAHRKAVEAVNRTLQDIRQNERQMGGITLLFCGDFRQTLPIVPRGTRADEVNACLKRSTLWSHVIRMNLSINMRAQGGNNPNATEFSNLLLQIGNDSYPREE